MSLVFSAIVPHAPILIPAVGQENLDHLKNTAKALKSLEERLVQAKPDTIVIITPHGEISKDSFAVGSSDRYFADFQQFGDFVTKAEYRGDPALARKIGEKRKDGLSVSLSDQDKLDHGCSVPLYYLASRLKELAVVPAGYSLSDYQAHFNFGKRLKSEIDKTDKRIAVIASGDLSHCLTPSAPANFSAEGKVFDNTLIRLIKKKNTKRILNLNKKLVEKAKVCGLRSVIVLLGVLDNAPYAPEILSYESPFGVGYAVVNFALEGKDSR